MVFSSPFFLAIFFPLLLVAYFFAKESFRNPVLLAFSLFFYAWGDPKALPLLFGAIVFNYFTGMRVGGGRNRKLWLWLGVFGNLGLLGIFKYLDFIVENINLALTWLQLPQLPEPHIGLPIGISFYIFQAISYIVDVFRHTVAPQSSLFRFSLYISLFPQLIAGPIVRYISIENELDKRALVPQNIQAGLIRFCIGLAKKVFLADSLGYVADCIFATPPEQLPCFWAWMGAITYAFQIYYDFSAYSDMAIGIGKIFNFHFPENFNYPYYARTLRNFWRSWHISLTTWLRDYLYIPLGGSRGTIWQTRWHILIVLLCCGIWHGAAWNFLIWGLYNGLGLIGERVIFRSLPRQRHLSWGTETAHHALTIIFVLVGWVIFRCESGTQFFCYLDVMFFGNPAYDIFSLASVWDECVTISNLLFLLIAFLCSRPYRILTYERINESISAKVAVLVLFVITYAFVMTSSYSPFLYFRF